MKKLFLILFFITLIVSQADGQSTSSQQTSCEKKAKKFFSKSEYNQTDKEGPRFVSSSYKSHYSKKLGKCFILINIDQEVDQQWASGVPSVFHQGRVYYEADVNDYSDFYLLDVPEGKEYGKLEGVHRFKSDHMEYDGYIINGKGENKNVTLHEFMQRIKPYMEE